MGDIVARLRDLPRLRLAHLPTPLEPMARLGEVLGLKSLWVKRDDCTGLGFGGNKVRKLEFSLAAAKTTGADCVICGGVVQSNTARQVASACAKLGIECHLGIMHGRLRSTEPGYAATGNILLGVYMVRRFTMFHGARTGIAGCGTWRPNALKKGGAQS